MANKQKDELASRTALLYYECQKSQLDIANELGISRSYVSQLLTYAREAGIVRISLNVDESYIHEIAFAEKFPGLQHVFILPSPSTEYTMANIGTFAAPHITRLLNESDTIGINLGYAVQSVIENLDESNFSSKKPKTIVQLMGGFLKGQNSMMMPGELVMRLSKMIGAECLYLNCPAVIDNASLKKDLLLENSISAVVKRWKDVNLAIMGIGVVNEQSRIHSMLSAEMKKKVQDSAACCEITLNYFDSNGRYLPILLENKISIPYEILKSIKIKAVIGHGEHKAKAILSALKAQMIDILITDSITISTIGTLIGSTS